MEGFLESGNTHILDSSFFNINHWVQCFITTLPNAYKQIAMNVEQLDEKIFQCLLGIFYKLTWETLFIDLGACGENRKGKVKE